MNKQRRALDKLVEAVLFEGALREDFGSRTLAPGNDTGFDPTVGNTTMIQQTVKAAPNDTVGEEVPLIPSAEMTAQLTGEMPPINDDEYVPASVAQFGLAMQALADDLSAEDLAKLYRTVKQTLGDRVTEDVIVEANPQSSSYWEDLDDEELYADMDEEERKELDDMIAQLKSQKASVPWSDIGTSKDPIHKIRGETEEEVEIEDVVEPIEVTRDGMNLEDLAKELGLKGASGARQSVARIVRRTNVVDRLMSPQQLTGLQTYATIQFIRGVTPHVEEDDVDELKLNRDVVRGLDSYRFFFVKSFILPIYNKIYRQTRKDIEGRLVRSGFPKRSAATVTNILFGESMTTPEKLKTKIQKDVSEQGSSVGVDELLDRLKSMYPTLKDLADLEGFDIGALARERWDGLGKARKEKEILAALEETQSFQDELDAKED